MELWIRVQNRGSIIYTKDVYYYCVCHFDKKHHKILSSCGSNSEFSLGEYKSKERCLEIIDEIQALLMRGDLENCIVHLHTNQFTTYDEAKRVVEEMKKNKLFVFANSEQVEFIQQSLIVYEMPLE